MNKKLFIFAVFLTIFLSSTCFAKCNLDLSRWEWVATNKLYSVYFDTKTVRSSNNSAEAWICWYFPSNCQYHTTGGEHYHYNLFDFNFGNNTCNLKSFINRDSNGKATGSYTYPTVDYRPIPPDTVLESIALAVKKKINASSQKQ